MPPSLGERAYAVVTRLLPGAIADRVLPGRRREFRETGVTRVAPAGRRLLIGPVNSAGQGFAWARAAERLPDVAAASIMYRGEDDVFGFTADHVIPVSALISNGRWRDAQQAAILGGFTHVVVESGRPVFGREGDVGAQLRMLQDRGVSVALVWHGSDIRLPSEHARREPDSPFRDGAYPDTEVLERVARENRELVERACVPVFVSTPDLVAFVPEAIWLPVVVDADRWAEAAALPALERERPVVVHAPSRAGLKGSDAIADVVRKLHDEGVIDYREMRGLPADQMPDFYGEADIVLDQFLIGSYGVAACEAMAAGRLVVGHVSDEVRAAVSVKTGLELPVVQARVAELEDVLRRIAADRGGYQPQAASGRAFVRTVHEGTYSADVLRSFLDA